MKIQRISHKTLAETAAGKLTASLLDGSLAHGTQLPPERELMNMFGISRATLREALKGLYQQQSRALQSEYQITYVSPFCLRDGINRNLTVSLASGATSTEGTYNPGGVLPEVTSRSRETFGAILLGLLILLFLPMLINLGSRSLSGLQQKSAGNPATSRLSHSHPPAAKGRIKLK
jgi:hypothetical protein